MGHEDGASVLTGDDRPELDVHVLPGHLVERAKRFVEEKQPRLVDQHATDRSTLLHASGQLRRITILESIESDKVDELEAALSEVALTRTLNSHRQKDVVEDGEPREEDGPLKHHSGHHGRLGHWVTIERHRPGRGS